MVNTIFKICLSVFFTFILADKFCAQITINWKLNPEKDIAEIVIYNNSNENIAIPIDTKSLQAHFNNSNKITETNWNPSYPFFALTLNVNDNTQNRIEASSSSPYLDISQFEKIKNEKDKSLKEYNALIKKWQTKYKIQKDDVAQINYYLLKSLLLIKPKERIKFSVIFNLRNITNQENSLHDSYLVELGKIYSSLLTCNIDESVYNYLTKNQRKKLRKYKLYSGIIESNKIELNNK